MKKIIFTSQLTTSLKDLLESVSQGIPEEKLSKVVAGDGCGGICRFTCSWNCRQAPDQNITTGPPPWPNQETED